MTRPIHDDLVGVAFSEQWSADEPPADFARNVTSIVREERKSSSRSGARGVVIPLLLAAIFVSFGAAAAWDTWGKPDARTAEAVAADPAQKAAARLTFHSHEENGRAEREEQQERVAVPVAKVKRTKSLQSTPVEPPGEAKEPPQEVEEEPEQVHYPRCECGTNGVVCTCVD